MAAVEGGGDRCSEGWTNVGLGRSVLRRMASPACPHHPVPFFCSRLFSLSSRVHTPGVGRSKRGERVEGERKEGGQEGGKERRGKREGRE